MVRPSRHRLFFVLLMLSLSLLWCVPSLAPLLAAEDRGDGGDAKTAEQIAQLDQQIRTIEEAEASVQAEILKSRRVMTDAELPQLDPAGEAAGQSHAEINDVRQRVGALESRLEGMVQQRREYQRKIETTLRDSGQWVSFTSEIAPIFHSHCVACHNARNSQGRYSMANFNAIRAMAETGEPIVPGDAENSLLYQMIADGSMPYDADPLSEEQIGLIKKWIDRGARIDSSADPDSSLIRLMPRIAQPKPPERYAAPIPVSGIAADPSGTRVASSGYHEVLLWSLPLGDLVGRISNVAERVHGLAFHPDGKRLAVAGGTPGQWGEVKIFDVDSGRLLADLFVSADAMFDVSFSPDGKQLAACGADGSIAIFSLDAAPSRPRVIEDHSDWVNSISWSPDGNLLVSTSRDKTAKVFDAVTGELKITFSGHNQNVTAGGFFPDGNRVFSGGDDRRIRIWNVADAKQVREITGLATEMRALGLLSGKQIVSAGSDGKVRIHQSDDGKLVRELASSSDWISSLTTSADNESILFGNHSGQIHVIPVNENRAGEHSWTAAPH